MRTNQMPANQPAKIVDIASRRPLSPTSPVTPENEERAAEAAAAAAPGGRARAYAREDDQALQDLCAYYEATFGRRAAPSIRSEIIRALDAGMTPRTVAMAMDAAAAASTPSWAYAAAVIAGCIRDGALTPEAFAARSAAHRAQRRPGRQPDALRYEQREYKPGEFEHLFKTF